MRCFLILVVALTFVSPAEAQKKKSAPKPLTNMELKRAWIKAAQTDYVWDKDFAEMVRDRELVRITDTRYHNIDEGRLDRDAEYIRPFVLEAIRPLEQGFYAKFKKSIRITAAVRTMEHHDELRSRNRNATPGRTPHASGYTLDIGYAWMTPAETRWIEAWLRARHRKSLVYTKEYNQRCYDVMFKPPPLPARPRHRR